MNEERLNEIWAVALFAAAIITFISLFSFDPNDILFYTSSPSAPLKNFSGIVGAYFAGTLFFAIGRSSFLVPFLLLVWAAGSFAGRRLEKLYLKAFGAAVLIIAASSFLSLSSGADSVERFKNGGIAGMGFSAFLVKYFSMAGAYIITLFLFSLALLLATEFLVFPFVMALFAGLKASGARISSKLLASGELLAKRASEKRAALSRPQPQLRIREAPVRVGPAKASDREPPKTVETPKKHPFFKAMKKDKPPPGPSAEKAAAKKEEGAGSASKNEEAGAAKKGYGLPPTGLLNAPPPIEDRTLKEDLDTSSKVLEETLGDFGLEVKVVKVERGPAITRYELEPAPGIKISRISALSDDIALAMKAQSVRVVAPIPGKGTVGVELPNPKTALVYLREVLESKEFKKASSESKLTMALGKDISGYPVIADLADMPHLLIAGTTGSGKTVCVNSLIASLLFAAAPDEVKFLMVDPKMVELSIYNDIPHLLCPVVTEAKKVSAALNWIVNEMETRYKLFASGGARNIEIYNQKARQKDEKELPYIVVIIDELADLMVVAQQEIESAITRLAQLSRAVGIHIILATQRPSVDVITGVIKANFPARISFKVASKVDSRTVLDMNGADKLLGKGDMLFIEPGASKPVRAQGSLVSDEEIEKIVGFIKSQGAPEYDIDILTEQKKTAFRTFEKDEVYEEAVRLVLQTKQASVSMLQRRLGLGYTRAARLIDMMEDEGIIGPYAGSKPRDILIEGLPKEKEGVAKNEERG